MEKQSIHLSKMPKTWILDLDGTIVRHDGPFLDGEDSFLPGAKEFLEQISSEDMIIFLTARTEYGILLICLWSNVLPKQLLCIRPLCWKAILLPI